MSSFTGVWSYRAIHDRVDLEIPFGDLRFASGLMTLRESSPGVLEGSVVGKGWGTWMDWSLALEGTTFFGFPHQLRLRGTNEIDGERWVYDYLGFLMPPWPHANETRSTIVGSFIRTGARTGSGAVCDVLCREAPRRLRGCRVSDTVC